MRLRHRLCSLVLVGVAFALPALADQFLWLDADQARRALAELPAGTPYVVWISHLHPSGGGVRPVLFEVVEASAVTVDAHTEIDVSARRVAEGEPSDASDEPFVWRACRRSPPERQRLDLAYVYVPSTEVPGMFVNLARKLRLECDVRWPALDVPAALARGADRGR